MAVGSEGRFLKFSTDYRDFCSKANPELQAFEELQTTYSKKDNILFVLDPGSKTVFSNDTLAAVEWLTHEAWQIPYTQRVDSISNFQHTYGMDDDLIVADLSEIRLPQRGSGHPGQYGGAHRWLFGVNHILIQNDF